MKARLAFAPVFFAMLLHGCIESAPAGPCGGLVVDQGWVREAAPGAAVLAGYFRLRNPSSREQTISGVSSPRFASAEMHETVNENGSMTMRALAPLRVPAGATVIFEPGGKHLMLMQPAKPLGAGDTVSLRFDCGSEPSLQLEFPVRQAP